MTIPSLTWAWRASGALFLCGSAFAQSLVNGGVVSGTISAPGERDSFTFGLFLLDSFQIRLVDVNATAFTPRIEVYNPSGNFVLANASSDVALIDTQQITGGLGSDFMAGTYTAVVSDPSGGTGAYDIHYVRVPRANEGGELLDGVMVSGEITRGDIDSFTYNLVPGRRHLRVITSESGLSLRHEDFEGGRRTGWGSGGMSLSGGFNGQGGLRTIVLSDGSPSAAGTGRYTIMIHGVAGVAPYPTNVFCPSEFVPDPTLVDIGGDTGLGPRIGDPAEPFNFFLDCSGADWPGIYLLSLTLGKRSPAVSTRWGWLYVDGPRLLQTYGSHIISPLFWFPPPAGLVLPNDPSLVGTTYTVQGACGGYGALTNQFRLSDAITQTIRQ